MQIYKYAYCQSDKYATHHSRLSLKSIGTYLQSRHNIGSKMEGQAMIACLPR